MFSKLKANIWNCLRGQDFECLEQAIIELNNVSELKKVFNWQYDPVFDRPDIYDFEYVEDVNERRVRDAESLATVIRNVVPGVALEIGTSNGMGTALMASNAPQSKIYTVNIPPEEIVSGEGGQLTTIALEREKIGAAYRERGLTNITQIYANTATWEPNIGTIDVAFIDGCHDADFVYNDTRKVLAQMKPGSFILWHDFNLKLANKYHWIKEVCLGVERLYEDGLLSGRIFQIRDSWVGIHRV
jgi:predicted O-methyltransferase YrrM